MLETPLSKCFSRQRNNTDYGKKTEHVISGDGFFFAVLQYGRHDTGDHFFGSRLLTRAERPVKTRENRKRGKGKEGEGGDVLSSSKKSHQRKTNRTPSCCFVSKSDESEGRQDKERVVCTLTTLVVEECAQGGEDGGRVNRSPPRAPPEDFFLLVVCLRSM